MPDAAKIDGFVGTLDDGRDKRDIVQALQERILDGLPEPPRKCQELSRLQIGVAEEEHKVLEPKRTKICNNAVGKLIEAAADRNLRPKGAQPPDSKSLS